MYRRLSWRTGAAGTHRPSVTPAVGTTPLGFYAAALAGFGFALGGALRPSLAGVSVALLALGIFLVDLLTPVLDLPDWVHQLALSSHMGRPMIGQWNMAGMAACAVLAVAGVAAGGWGIRRRDINR